MAQGHAHQEEISYSSSSAAPDEDDKDDKDPRLIQPRELISGAIVWHRLVLPTSDGEAAFADFLDGLIAGFEETLSLPRMATVLEGARVRVVEAQVRRERLVKAVVAFFSAGGKS